MLKFYLAILLTFHSFTSGLGQGNSITIQRIKTCIEPAYEFINNSIELNITYRNKAYVKLYYLGHLKYSELKKTHKLYYAHFNTDSTLSQRRVAWRRVPRKDSIAGKYYCLIPAKDYSIYKIYYKEKTKVCDLCADEEKILYLDQPIPQRIKRDPIIYERSAYRHPLLKPNYLSIKIKKDYIPYPELYYEDSLKLKKINWKEPWWRKKGYYYALIPATRNSYGTKVGPIVYKQQNHCPYEPMPSLPSYFVNADRFIGNYFSGLRMDIGMIPKLQSQFISLGYHYRFNRQSLNLSLSYTTTSSLFPRLQYQFYLFNKRNYNHFRYNWNIVYKAPLSYRDIINPTNTQVYIGTESFLGKTGKDWVAFQRLYLGYNKQIDYFNFYINYGINSKISKNARTTRYLELGLKVNIPVKRRQLIRI